MVVFTLFLSAAFLPVGLNAQASQTLPPPFDRFGVGILSEPVRLALSNQGRILYRSQHVAARGLVRFAGGDPSAVVAPVISWQPAPFTAWEAPAVGTACGGTTNGAKFNLEPIAGDPLVNLNAGGFGAAVVQPLQQDEESVDFLFAGGGSGGDFLVGGANDLRGFFGGMGFSATLTAFHTKNLTTGTFDCAVEVEAATPDVIDVHGVTDSGFGDPAIAADNSRMMIFAADLHFGTGASGFTETSIGLFRTTPASVDAASCLAAAEGKPKNAACWPKGIVLNAADSGAAAGIFNDKPHMTVDERSTGTGTGAGDVYVTWTEFTAAATNIDLVACKNSFLALADCSSIVHVASVPSASPSFLQFSHVAVRPANASSSPGEITVTYIEPTPVGFGPPPTVPATETMDIHYVKCAPKGAPAAPICGAPGLVFSEKTPIFFPGGAVSGELFRAATYPKHDHRVNSTGGTDTFVTWDHCSINPVSLTAYSLGGFGGAPAISDFICPNADVLISMSSNDGATWSAPTILAGGAGDQFFPWLRADRGSAGNSLGTVNIAYYDTAPDLSRHDLKVKIIQIPPTSNTGGTPVAVTSLNNDPSGDFDLRDLFYGDYIGVFARGSGTAVGSCAGTCRAYPSYTRSNDPGKLGGAGHGGTGAGSVTLTETNNHVSLVTY
jgi:hypothetical protein